MMKTLLRDDSTQNHLDSWSLGLVNILEKRVISFFCPCLHILKGYAFVTWPMIRKQQHHVADVVSIFGGCKFFLLCLPLRPFFFFNLATLHLATWQKREQWTLEKWTLPGWSHPGCKMWPASAHGSSVAPLAEDPAAVCTGRTPFTARVTSPGQRPFLPESLSLLYSASHSPEIIWADRRVLIQQKQDKVIKQDINKGGMSKLACCHTSKGE